MLAYLIGLMIVGLIVGALARLFVPGPDPMGIGMTMLIGIAGSFIAGILVAEFHGRGGAGFLLSVLCSIGLVYAVRRSRERHLRGPYRPGDPYDRPGDPYDQPGLPLRRRYW